MHKKVIMLGTFDTKGREFKYLYDEIMKHGVEITAMNAGVMGATDLFPVDIQAEEVALAGGAELENLRRKGDRGLAMKVMARGAKALVQSLYQEGKLDGIIGMGGGGGTSIVSTAMQGLPVGVPKVCVTTLASGDTSPYVSTKDIVLFPSIVDICGINRFSRMILSRAAGAVCGMVGQEIRPSESDRPLIFISMFGNSTQCVEQCMGLLDQAGYDTMVFHVTGTGGRAMEELILQGYPTAVLDVTTTEWADEVGGGVLSAGPSRLDGPGIKGIPHLIVPGCVDMINFGPGDTIPPKFRDGSRLVYEWNPMVTLVRTDRQENVQMGIVFAGKANASKGKVKFAFPLRGVSILDGEGQLFQDWDTNRLLFDTIKKNLNPGIEVREIDANINDMEFSQTIVSMLLEMLDSD
ncbi:MAG: Tm-1-like ATP-binding domain-containing protein [Clostridium sp.]|nr:Tm-1-like ATP-binding domain-containing protein [Clostridium sp.]